MNIHCIIAVGVLGAGLGLLLGNAYGFARGRDGAREGADAATVAANGMVAQARDMIDLNREEIRRNAALSNELRERISKHDTLIAAALRKARGDGDLLVYASIAAVLWVAAAMAAVFHWACERSRDEVLLMYGITPEQRRLLLRAVERQMRHDETAAGAVEAGYVVSRQ